MNKRVKKSKARVKVLNYTIYPRKGIKKGPIINLER